MIVEKGEDSDDSIWGGLFKRLPRWSSFGWGVLTDFGYPPRIRRVRTLYHGMRILEHCPILNSRFTTSMARSLVTLYMERK